MEVFKWLFYIIACIPGVIFLIGIILAFIGSITGVGEEIFRRFKRKDDSQKKSNSENIDNQNLINKSNEVETRVYKDPEFKENYINAVKESALPIDIEDVKKFANILDKYMDHKLIKIKGKPGFLEELYGFFNEIFERYQYHEIEIFIGLLEGDKFINILERKKYLDYYHALYEKLPAEEKSKHIKNFIKNRKL